MSEENKTPADPFEELAKVVNDGWDDLMGLRTICTSTLYQMTIMVKSINTTSVQGAEVDESLKAALVDTFNSINVFNNELNDIYSNHEGRVGNGQNPDEVVECIRIGTLYQDWLARVNVDLMNKIQNLATLAGVSIEDAVRQQ